MISKKNLTTIHKSATLFVVFMLVFGANIASAQYTETQYVEPNGPPPGNNAPAPIHEGTLGQGKYWSSIPQYSLGSFLNIVEGMFSSFVVSDGAGVAATQFCLGTPLEIAQSGFATDGTTTGLNCLTDATGWPADGSDGSPGGPGGPGDPGDPGDPGTGTSSSIPNGDIWHQFLYYSNETSSWKPLPLSRIWTPLEQYLAGSTSIVDIIDAGLPLPGPSIEFGSTNTLNYAYDPAQIPATGDAYFDGAVNMIVTGSFTAQNETPSGSLNTLSMSSNGTRVNGPLRIQHVTGENVPINNILANTTTNGQSDWKSAAELGLVTQTEFQQFVTNITNQLTDITNQLNEIINGGGGNGTTLPEGTQDGQMLWLNDDFDPPIWTISNTVRLLGGNTLSFIQATLKLGPNSDLVFANNDNCPADSAGSVMRAAPRVNITGIVAGEFDIGCSEAIKISTANFDGSNDETVVISNVPQLDDTQVITAGPRNLCYTTLDIPGVEKGLLVDCEASPSGTFTVNGPVPLSPTYNPSISDSNVQVWNIPFGVTSVTVRACAGGGGGGGGSAGLPGNVDKPGGAGGGGGGAGQCTEQVLPLTESNITALRLTAGRGGAGGAGGIRYCGTAGQSANSCGNTTGDVNTGNGNNGSNGFLTKVEKMSGNTVLSTPINLTPGSGGSAGRIQCAVNGGSEFECGTFGGPGGKGGHVPLIASQLSAAQGMQQSNGQHGREIDFNNASTPTLNGFFYNAQYYSGFCNNASNGSVASCGGDGGNGQVANLVHPTISNPYDGFWALYPLTGQGGGGGTGCSGCNTHFDEDWQGSEVEDSAQLGSWGSGGGGGGGARGWIWVDYNNESGYEYQNHAGNGSRGGPGFVYLSW